MRPNQTKSRQMRPNQTKSRQMRPNQTKSRQMRPNQIKSRQMRLNQIKPRQMRQNQIKPIQIKPHQMRRKSKPNLWRTRCPKKTTLMKDPLPQKDNPYAGLVAPKRQPLTQDMSDMKTFLKYWLSSKKRTIPMPKTSTILHQSICLHTHKHINS